MHELQVKALTAENDALRNEVARQRSTQANELKHLELTQKELNNRYEDLADEKKLLQEQLSKATLAASDPNTSMVRYGFLHNSQAGAPADVGRRPAPYIHPESL